MDHRQAVLGQPARHGLRLGQRAVERRELQRDAACVAPARGAGRADDQRVVAGDGGRQSPEVGGLALPHHAGVHDEGPRPLALGRPGRRREQQLPGVAGRLVVEHQHRVVEVGEPALEVEGQQHLEQHGAEARVGRAGDAVAGRGPVVAEAVDQAPQAGDVGMHLRRLDPRAVADQREVEPAERVAAHDQALPHRVGEAARPVAEQRAVALLQHRRVPAQALAPLVALHQALELVGGIERDVLLDLQDLQLADPHAAASPPVCISSSRAARHTPYSTPPGCRVA